MSSQAPPQEPGGFKGLFKGLGTKFKREKRAKKDKNKGHRAYESLSVPVTGEEYESSTYSAGQSRSTTPVPKESHRPATPATANSVLGPVHQTTPHRPSIRDLRSAGTGNDHNPERAPEPAENTFDPLVTPSTFEQRLASAGGDNNHAGGVIDDGKLSILPRKEQDLESSALSAAGPIDIRAPSPSAVDKLLPPLPLDAPMTNLPMVEVSTAPSSADNNIKSASDISVPTSTQASNRTARLWFDATTGFGKTLLKKLPDAVDSNPVKVVAAIVKVAIEAAETVGANKDNLTRLSIKLESLAQLEATEDGIPTGAEAIFESFKGAMSNASAKISNLRSQSRALQAIAYEQYSKEIQGVLDDIDDAVQAFQVLIASQIKAEATQILAMARDEQLRRLNPSPGAHYDSDVEGQRIRREECTKGTRIGILDNIAAWARDESPQSPLVYWLTGQAGSGKTTIATSIAAKFSGAAQGIALGADFFCSRNSPESNTTRRIVPTIAYQLARKCAPYAEALVVPSKLDKLDAVYSPVRKQLQSLFLIPWVQCEAHRSQSRYLIVIDALDELKENGSAEFLDGLFTLFEASPVNGVKIFITSRPEDRIVKRIESFHSRAIARLQEVPLEDVSPDIRKYLEAQLPTLGNGNLNKLSDLAAGLFIYAATAVRCIKPRDDTSVDDQKYLLQEFLKYARNAGTSRPDFIVDELYQQIMGAALCHYIRTPRLLAAHLGAIHTALSTGERASAATIAALFNSGVESTAHKLTEDSVMSVVRALHAVLYLKDGLIFWYHASFPDFIFDSSRSNFTFITQDGKIHDCQFTCNEESQQTWLRNLCFNKLQELRFNISSIPSSFALDQDFSYIPDALLVYSAANWSHHLPITGGADADDIGEFLCLRALFWIELMNIIKRVSDCVSILKRAQRWVRQHIVVDEAALDERLSEVIKFVNTFQAEAQLRSSTPHLYISHLAAWSGSPKTIQRWKENFRNLPFITHSHQDIPLIFTADGQQLIKEERVAPEVKLENRGITSVAFLNKGTQLLSGYKDGSISIWDASTGALQVHLEVDEQQLPTQTWSNATAMIGFEDCVCVWNSVSNASPYYTREAGANKGFWSITASADGTKIRSESLDEKVYIWGLISGRWQLISRFESSVQGSVSPNHAYLINTTDMHNTTQINIHKVTPAKPQIICPPLKDVVSVAIYRHGAKLQIAYEQCVPRPRELVCLEGLDDENHSFGQMEHNSLQKCTAVMPDSFHGFNHLNPSPVTISPDQSIIGAGKVRLWDPVTGIQQQLPYRGPPKRCRSVAISKDNKHILLCDHMSICLWDISRETRSALLKEHTDSARDFQNWELQPDGWIVSSRTKDRLMWVSKALWNEERFSVPQSILFLSAKGYYSVDFSKSMVMLGANWATCYQPILPQV